jgi:crotonobetainyl-CoA:carnitine CoA-transferase CaiB-like acyl-CoA transferase
MEQVLDKPEVAQDPRYATGKQRSEHRQEIFKLLDELFIKHPWTYWQGRMRAAGVPCGKVRTVSEALRSPEAMDRKIVSKVAHPKVGWVPNISLPIRYQQTPMANPIPAPMVGEHTLSILKNNLGYSSEKIETYLQKGVFGVDVKLNEVGSV